ncbi:MAG TPA: response regulator, partial [Longimicrobiales bacterium]
MTSRTIRILVIDDDQGDFEMARSMIGAIEQVEIAYDVDWVSSFQEAVAAFDQDLYDVYFVDYFLEDQ